MNRQSRETYYMEKALIEAKKARAIGEVPIGAVVVYQDTIIGRGYNQRETSQNATTHAEMIAIQEACDYLKVGALKIVSYMSHWNLVPCVVVLLLCHACHTSTLVHVIQKVEQLGR